MRRTLTAALLLPLLITTTVIAAQASLTADDMPQSFWITLDDPEKYEGVTSAVQTLDGKPVDMKQYYGKTPVVIEFWATWCPNCKDLEPAFAALKKRRSDLEADPVAAEGVSA